MDTLAMVRAEALAALRPPPRLPLSEWAERRLRLPDGVAAMPGPIQLWPFQRTIADSISNPTVERVTVRKATRVGFSTLLTAAVGHFAANDPTSIILVLPTEADCRDVVVSDLEPIFEATPDLRGLLQEDFGDEKRNTMMHRRFSGGSLKVIAAKAPRNLRRHTARVLFIDEADGMEVTSEGSPITLAEQRTLSFQDRKIVCGSTPVDEDTSHICRLYLESDQRVFEVPCVRCGVFFEITWSCIEWETGRPETAACRCPSCEALIEERHKVTMVSMGRWRPTRPEVLGHHGYHLTALVSPHANASWPKLASEFLAAQQRPDLLRVFANTALAEPWREAGEAADETALAARAETFGLGAIPSEVLTITAGVDVQRDRLEVTLVGWTEADDMLILGHHLLIGDPHDDATWAELDVLLRTRWPHPLGGKITVDAAVVDSGDGATCDAVYAFCAPRAGRRILAGKGMSGDRQALTMGGKVRGGGRVWIVAVDGIKSQLLARIQSGRSVRFSADLEPVFYEQLTSERRVVRYARGRPKAMWTRIPGRDAEALDCVVYAMAARKAFHLNTEDRRRDLAGAPKAEKVWRAKSKWMER